MGVVEEKFLLKTVEGNINRIKELQKLSLDLSAAILEGRVDDPERALSTEFSTLMEINGLYDDSMNLLDQVTSEENYFQSNRFYKELINFKPLRAE